ncbi:hypothetical protein KKG36_02305 [Patescibacteria group bacterium]|nr:hypothetical protein [Patescibacteria group bacterium]
MLSKEELTKLYTGGLSLDKIAVRQGISRNGVRYWMGKYNIPTRPRCEAGFVGYWGLKPNLPKQFDIGQIKDLYYSKGLSAEDIGRMFNRKSSSVYRFMKGCGLARRLPKESNEIKYSKQALSFCPKPHLSTKEKTLKTAGIMLYWAEGAKRFSTVDLANSDPRMVGLFVRFLRQICMVKEDRLRVQLYCYCNQDVPSLKSFWSALTKIPESQFIKPYVRTDFKKEKINKMPYGLVHIRYSDKKLLEQIKRWIEEFI